MGGAESDSWQEAGLVCWKSWWCLQYHEGDFHVPYLNPSALLIPVFFKFFLVKLSYHHGFIQGKVGGEGSNPHPLPPILTVFYSLFLLS